MGHGAAAARIATQVQRFEGLGIVKPNCAVVVDHALRPGAPRLLWQLHACHRLDDLFTFSAQDAAMGLCDWVAVGRLGGGISREAPGTPQDLVALAAESDWLWDLLSRPRLPSIV